MDAVREKKLGLAVGAAIAQARSAAGFTQEQVAEALAIGPEAVSRMERGVVIPSLPRLVEFARLFECPVENLIKRGSDQGIDQALLLQGMMGNLKEADRQFVIALMEQVCEHLRQGRR